MSETTTPTTTPPGNSHYGSDQPAPRWEPQMPAQVRAAAARAEELAREMHIAPPEDGDNSVGSDGAQPSEEQVTTVVNDERPGDSRPAESRPSAGDNSQGQQAQPQAEWEQRYNTLQGKYNAELPELRGQIRSLQDIIASMQQAQTRANSVVRQAPEVSGDDVETYGQDLITASQRWAEAGMATRLAEYERRLHQVESGGQQLARHTAAQGVERALEREFGAWQQINVDPKFMLWLDQTDPFTGQKRHTLLNEAYGAGDAARTIAFFRAFLTEQTAVSPSNGAGIRPHHTGNGSAPPSSADRLPLAELAVPGRGQQAASAAPGAPDRRIWANSEIATFYRQKQQGRWQGREADADAIERDIFAASREGRVRQ